MSVTTQQTRMGPAPAAVGGALPFTARGADQAARLRSLVVHREAAAAAPTPASARVRPPIVTVSSGKGGVGKTSVCVNLAIALAELRRRTTLVDADLGMANADVLCGMSPARRLDAIIAQGRSAREIAVEAPGGFRLVPGAIGVERIADLAPADRERLLAGLAELERDSDLLLLDTAAGLGRAVTGLMRAADACLIVVTPEPTSIADAYALIKVVLRREHAPGSRTPSPMLIVNQARNEDEAESVHARLEGVCQRFLARGLSLLGWVPQDPTVAMAVRRRRPVLLDSPSSPASRQIRTLALALVRALRPGGPLPASEPERGGLRRVLSALMLRGG